MSSESLHRSMSELVWVALMVLVMLFAFSQNKAQKVHVQNKKEVAKFKERIVELEAENLKLKLDLESLSVQRSNEQLREENEKLVAEVKALEVENKILLESVSKLKVDNAHLITRIETLKKQLSDMSALLESYKDKGDVRDGFFIASKDMIGIEGNLNRVAVVVDTSSSMVSGKKWKETKRIIGTWISNLDIENLLLITYGSEIDVFENRFIYVKKSGPGVVNENLRKIIGHLEGITPGGSSHTYYAIEKAYRYKPDTIILFTDGSPSHDGKAEMQKIRRLVSQHSNVPINIIGLGDYFHPEVGSHIRELLRITEGVFIGR